MWEHMYILFTLSCVFFLQISGFLWKANFLKIQSFTVPKFIAKIFGSTVQKLLDSSPPKDLMKPIGATREIQRQEQMEQLEQQMLWQTFQQQRHPQQNGWFNLNGGQVCRITQVLVIKVFRP